MNMKKLLLQTIRLTLLLTLLSGPALTKCANAMDQEPTAHRLPDPLARSGTIVNATYAVKNLFSSIMETFPDLTIEEALLQSALLGIISEVDVQLHMYGTFTTQPDPKKPGRTMKLFDTDTALNKSARSMFDFLDGKLRPTALASNPFVGLNGIIIAKMMIILKKYGVQGLIDSLERPIPSTKETRGKKRKRTPTEPEELSLLDEWWESYRSSRVKGVFTQKSKFIAKILGNPQKIDSQEDLPFIEILKELAAEALTDPEQAHKQKEKLSKMLMTFLYLKDHKQKATGESEALKEYYTTLLGKPFETEQYTTEELDEIGKALLGKDTTHSISKDVKGIEDTSAYLAHFVAGDVAFLETPSGRYSYSPEKTFAYCAEATVRSIMNSILYNPKTGKLDMAMLPPTIRVNAKFKDFIEKYPDPTVANYYGNSLKEWLDLVSGLDGVIYKKGRGKDAYEISASAGPKNLVALVNYIFGIHADSFETLARAFELKDDNGATVRKVSFTPNQAGFNFEAGLSLDPGFNLEVSYYEKIIIQAAVESEVNSSHASFIIKAKKIIHLLENSTFQKIISEQSNIAKQDLYGIIFKPSTLNIPAPEDFTPLLIAIKEYAQIAKIMLAFGADPNFEAGHFRTPLEEAIFIKNDDLVYDLLNYGAIVTEKALDKACSLENFELVKLLISFCEKQKSTINFNIFSVKGKSLLYTMLITAFTDKTYFSIVRYLIERRTRLLIYPEKNIADHLIMNLIANENLDLLDYLITSATIWPNTVSSNGHSLLFIALETNQFATAELLITGTKHMLKPHS